MELTNSRLSLIVPCYNESKTLEACVKRCMVLMEHGINLEIIIVDDCSTDGSSTIADELAQKYSEVKVFHQPKNMGKGAALRTGFKYASGDYVGIQDADSEYDTLDYLELIKPLLAGEADVVYGSRYVRRDMRRVLYFWHTWMNRSLTFISNMFTNLDITDMETCYKLFTAQAIRQIIPLLKENRFGFEPEVTELISRLKFRVYECAIHYKPRTYEEGKKIGWKDGLRALYCILHYGAPYAPLPMQLILYFFIGLTCAIANIVIFAFLEFIHCNLVTSVVAAFILAAILNYLLCIAILFQHKARWTAKKEFFAYIITVIFMCVFDYFCTFGLVCLNLTPLWAKIWATVAGFIGNFLMRKYYVF